MRRLKYFLIFAFGLSYLNALYASDITITLEREDSVNYVFCIHNNAKDTVYLLNTYLLSKNGFRDSNSKLNYTDKHHLCFDRMPYNSYVFHRYDKNANTYKLSLLPIVRELGVNGYLSDVVSLSEDRYLHFQQLGYNFTPIEPKSNYLQPIEKEAFYSTCYIRDLHIEKQENCFKPLNRETNIVLEKHPASVILELAVYRNIDHIAPFSAPVLPNIRYDQGMSFETIAITVSLPEGKVQE